MRVLPPKKEKEKRKVVVEKWASLLLEWASAEGRALVSVAELSRTPPFDVQPELLEEAIKYLIGRGQARWREKGKSLFLLWRRPEDWAMRIYEWLRENFKEVFSLWDLMEAGEDFSSLPKDELEACLRILEKNNLISRLKKVKGYYKLVLPGV